jgi:calcineurin-like phosphoesterase family protein
MEWITADTHFGHENIIKYCQRPFSSVEEMDAELIRRWNERVSPKDIVYHLGDFTLKKSADEYLDQLQGKIRLVPGSHDYWLKHVDLQKYKGKLEILPLYTTIRCMGKKMVLCHYPMRSWDSSHYGSFHLHGHSHGTILNADKFYDVGVDCTESYAPVVLSTFILNEIEQPLITAGIKEENNV